MMTKNQAQALAAFVHELRSDWDAAGVLAQLAKVKHLNAYEVTHALLRLAENPVMKTPGSLPVVGGEHWRERSRVSETSHPPRRDEVCPSHPTYRASNCGGCRADSLAAPAYGQDEAAPKPPRTWDAASPERRTAALADARAQVRAAGGAS